MKKILFSLLTLALVWSPAAFAQTAVTSVSVDIHKAKLQWDWAQGVSPNEGIPDKYNVKCGNVTGVYTKVTAVPHPTKELAVELAIAGVGNWFCVVTAQNAFGESAPTNEVAFAAGTVTVPASGLRLVVNAQAPPMTFSYLGKLRDRVGSNHNAPAPDGALDGTFLLTLDPSVGGKVITQLAIHRTPLGDWDTIPTSTGWIIGVASAIDGPLLNTAGGAVNVTVAAGGTLHLFIGEYGLTTGSVFTLTATFSDSTVATATATI